MTGLPIIAPIGALPPRKLPRIFVLDFDSSDSPRRGAESNQNFRSSIYASGDPIISYQIQISLASLIIQCY